MSEYKDFIQDYPSRCDKLFNQFSEETDLDVTLLLALATNAIIFPLERLGKNNGDYPHPAGDGKKFARAKDQFHNKIKNRYFIPDFCAEGSLLIGTVNQKEITKPNSIWIEKASKLGSDKKTYEILEIFRNGLAHGSIFIEPAPETDKIETLIFLSEDRKNDNKPTDDYLFVVIKVVHFKSFLGKWILFLKTLKLS